MVNILQRKKITDNPYLLFSPFLVLYFIYILIFPTNGMVGDETRYLRLAHNLMHGMYSSPAPYIDLPNGPGYPLFLVPFLALKIPYIYIALFNGLFQYLSIVLLYKTLRMVVSKWMTIATCVFWGCYYVAFQNLSRLTTEPMTVYLIALFIYCLLKTFEADGSGKSRKYMILSGISLGLVALVKAIFGYVILFVLIGLGILWILKRSSVYYKKSLVILVIALGTTLPYLVYTYNLTGRLYYWGTGNDNLYWMSTPYEDEFGDWKGELTRGTYEMGNYNIPGAEDTLQAHHGEDFAYIMSHTGIEKDDAFRKLAIRNIKAHPVKFGKNIFYNLGRMFFHYPYSYAIERRKSLFAMPINGFVLTLMLLCVIPTWRNWRKLAFPIRLLLVTWLIYMAGSAVLASDLRMFATVVPFVLVWIAYILDRAVRLRLNFTSPTVV